MSNMLQMLDNSLFFGGNAPFVEELYETYLDNPTAIPAEWRDYFDRLALDRSRDLLGAAARKLTAQMLADGKSGDGAVEAWVQPRHDEVQRIRSSMHEIADTGLTLSKLAVAASLLGDLGAR